MARAWGTDPAAESELAARVRALGKVRVCAARERGPEPRALADGRPRFTLPAVPVPAVRARRRGVPASFRAWSSGA